ncbi:MAG: RNA polymerase sigma factor [Cyanobacteria bacterium]|nr:RNA polymerase sigma factor [Cyanobacteriota bacterium]
MHSVEYRAERRRNVARIRQNASGCRSAAQEAFLNIQYVDERQNDGRIRQTVEELYRSDSRRIFATLIRLVGDFDLAEEVLQEAFAAAMQQWPADGVPANPRSWIVSTARFKAIDMIRRRARFDKTIAQYGEGLAPGTTDIEDLDEATFKDDHLRLIFTCCHPALSPNAQIALTLRETCGLRTEEIASAFLTSAVTIAQRIVRAKAKIRDAKIPYEVPALAELPERLDSVLSVIYLVFNEGYSASSGGDATRPDVSGEAIRLGRVLLELLPDSEVMGLLALMLLHESRRVARTDENGDLILLEDQDRGLWNQQQIEEGSKLVEAAFAKQEVGVYTIQAAISAVHASASTAVATDWAEIVSLYNLLLEAEKSPVVELNRAVAIAMRDGPEAGLEIIDAILARGELNEYHLAHAARADMCRRLGKTAESLASYEVALSLAKQEPERRFLARRLNELR